MARVDGNGPEVTEAVDDPLQRKRGISGGLPEDAEPNGGT